MSVEDGSVTGPKVKVTGAPSFTVAVAGIDDVGATFATAIVNVWLVETPPSLSVTFRVTV